MPQILCFEMLAAYGIHINVIFSFKNLMYVFPSSGSYSKLYCGSLDLSALDDRETVTPSIGTAV